MKLPTIDLHSLPGLETLHGLYGSMSHLATAAVDDSIVVLMVYLYDIAKQ